jgi:RNA polymerase sigma-70 factor (ECF subfamily)
MANPTAGLMPRSSGPRAYGQKYRSPSHNFRSFETIAGVGYLRLVRSAAPARSQDNDCVDAFDRELDYLYVLLQRFGARPAEIEDLLQDIFVVLRRHWPKLDTTRPLRPWLFGVALRVVRAQRRRAAREVLWDTVEPQDTVASPEVGFEEQESVALLRGALEQVPAARRSVIIMHELDGIEVTEIARRLDMSKIGVYTRLYKGRRELATALRRMGRMRA